MPSAAVPAHADSQRQAAGPPAGASPGGIEGVVGTIGVEPMVSIAVRPASGDPVRVTGPLAAELGQLTGATVRLTGDVRQDAPWPVIEPSSYEVTAIDGQKPYVGILQVEGTDVRLNADSVLRLLDVPDLLRQQHGAKVYVLGSRRGDAIAITGFGVISPPARQ
jgi:hypothetical protein